VKRRCGRAPGIGDNAGPNATQALASPGESTVQPETTRRNRSRLSLCALAVAFALSASASIAQPFVVNADDTLEKLLAAQKGKRVTVKLGPNDELTGVVKAVTPNVVHLGELTGREFFDAAVDLKRIRAVIVRTKN
jgi:hypothetical protein